MKYKYKFHTYLPLVQCVRCQKLIHLYELFIGVEVVSILGSQKVVLKLSIGEA